MTQRHVNWPAIAALAVVFAAIPFQAGLALITGGEGNDPITDPGWPAGAAAVFNDKARVAYWEGPPFGGGQYHGEYRGDTKTFQAFLDAFATIEAKNKRIVVHDGVGHSFWLNPNRKDEKKEASKIDWMFMVWVPGNFARQRALPADISSVGGKGAEKVPPTQIDVYTGGNIRWADIKVPEGIAVSDKRLEAHGFKLSDGVVLEGTVHEVGSDKPIAAEVRLERLQSEEYVTAVETKADAKGHWVIKNATADWNRAVLSAEGYVPRVLSYNHTDGQPSWHDLSAAMATTSTVSGVVTNHEGKPLAGVNVRLANVTSKDGARYDSALGYEQATDDKGRFAFDQVPLGTATIWVRKDGYVRPGLGENVTLPAKDVALKMIQSAKLRVTVDFTGVERPDQYIVAIEPEGGSVVGSWGGSGRINDKNEITFEHIPPGRYVIQGHPNPTSEKEKTKPVKLELKGGEKTEVTISLRAGT